MKFLVDAQLPPGLAGWLRDRGHEAEHVFDKGMVAATDATIATYAEANGSVLVSKDEDFLYLSQRGNPAGTLLWIRLGNCRNAALIAAIDAQLPDIADMPR